MKFLLDTHISLWAITDDPKLPIQVRELFFLPTHEFFVSAASIWEISIKYSLSKTNMPISGKEALGYFQEAGYTFLPITPSHAAYVEGLPLIHHDPFDRILIAQAKYEPMHLLTHDKKLGEYGELIVLV